MRGHWLKTNDPIMSGEQPNNEPAPPDDLTDVDIYCLHCGYNLRGLSGDPRRCPECGNMNPIGDSAAISELVAREQMSIDSLHISCLRAFFIFLFGLICVVPLPWFKGDLLDPRPCYLTCCSILLLVFGPLWVRRVRQFGESCGYRCGWRSWLVKYHLTSLLLVSLVVGSAFLLVWSPFLVGPRWMMKTGFFISYYAIVVGVLVFGAVGCWKSYRRLMAKRLQLQEGVALERARLWLRERLTRAHE